MIFLRGNWISLYQRSFKEKIERREKLILSEFGKWNIDGLFLDLIIILFPSINFFFFFKEKIERREKLILSESGNEISMVYFSIGNNFVPVDKLFFFSRGEMNFVNKIDDRLRNHLWGCKIYVTLMFYYAKGRKELWYCLYKSSLDLCWLSLTSAGGRLGSLLRANRFILLIHCGAKYLLYERGIFEKIVNEMNGRITWVFFFSSKEFALK